LNFERVGRSTKLRGSNDSALAPIELKSSADHIPCEVEWPPGASVNQSYIFIVCHSCRVFFVNKNNNRSRPTIGGFGFLATSYVWYLKIFSEWSSLLRLGSAHTWEILLQYMPVNAEDECCHFKDAWPLLPKISIFYEHEGIPVSPDSTVRKETIPTWVGI